MNRIIEYYFNGKLYRKCSYNKWNYTISNIRNMLKKKGYIRVYPDSVMSYDEVYVNLKKGKVIVIAHRIFTGHCDCKGRKLYEGDTVVYSNDEIGTLHKYFDRDSFYTMNDRGFITEVLNWDKYEKIGDCIDIDKKYWKVVEEFDKKEL